MTAQVAREYRAAARSAGLTPNHCPRCGAAATDNDLMLRRVEVVGPADDAPRRYVRLTTSVIGCRSCFTA